MQTAAAPAATLASLAAAFSGSGLTATLNAEDAASLCRLLARQQVIEQQRAGGVP